MCFGQVVLALQSGLDHLGQSDAVCNFRVYDRGGCDGPIKLLITTSLLTTWTASGVVISWMEGFRTAYQLPQIWGLVKERAVACSLVVLAGIPMTIATTLVAFRSQIESRAVFHTGHRLGPLIADVDWNSLVASDPDQHCCNRADLPKCGPTHSALAQCSARRRRGDGSVVRHDFAVWLVPEPLRRIQSDLRFARCWHRITYMDASGLIHSAGRCRV